MTLPSPEELWDEFVPLCGGELVRNLVPRSVREANADYVFRNANVILELKTLERDTFTPEFRRKFDAMVQGWIQKRWILVFGTNVISLRRVPEQCQVEWLRLVEKPIQQHILIAANKQIKSTRTLLNMPDATGVLVLAGAGNRSFAPADVVSLVRRIWLKRHPSGAFQYSGLNHLVYFSVHTPVTIPALGRPAFYWFAGYRQPNPAVSAFLIDLEAKWHRFLEEKLGLAIERIELTPDALEDLKFV